jgi:hypothetical protein
MKERYWIRKVWNDPHAPAAFVPSAKKSYSGRTVSNFFSRRLSRSVEYTSRISLIMLLYSAGRGGSMGRKSRNRFPSLTLRKRLTSFKKPSRFGVAILGFHWDKSPRMRF